MKVETFETAESKVFHVYIEKSLTAGAIADSIDMARKEIAKKIWEENSDKIMAQMDLRGLANLIAIEASEALKRK